MIQSAEYIYSKIDNQKICVNITYTNGKIWSVPLSEENTHYKQLLKWVEEGNTITDNPPE